MATNKLKFGTETPTKLYLGTTEVTKAYMGETLVYETSQQDELAGTWVINDNPEGFGDNESHRFTISFVSNGASYNSIDIQLLPSSPFVKDNWIYYDSELVYADQVGNESGWQNEAYKTITITSKLSEVTDGDTLLAWLQANGTKQ